MKLKEIMSRNVEVVTPDTPIQAAAEKMRALDVGPLPVCDGDRLVGMVTDRDITVRATAEGAEPFSTRVGDVMTAEAVFAFEDDDIEKAAQMMRDKQIRRLAVLHREKQLVGIVALGDLAVDTGDEQQSGSVLKEVSRPS